MPLPWHDKPYTRQPTGRRQSSSQTSAENFPNFTAEVGQLLCRSLATSLQLFLRFSIALFSNHLQNPEKSCRGFAQILLWI